MGRKQQLTHRGVQQRAERERSVGLESDDDAALWLDEHDPKPKPQPPKSASKSKVLHQWRQRRQRG